MSKKMQYRIEYLLLQTVSMVLNLLPLKIMYMIIDALAWITYRVFGIRRDVTIENLRIAFKDRYTDKELDDIALRSYKHIAATFAEMAIPSRFRDSAKEIMPPPEIEKFREVLNRGKGIVLVSSHFGSWEMIGASIASNGFPVSAVAKPQKNPYINDFINKSREYFGLKVIPTGASIKHIIRYLLKGEAVGLISDQDAGRKGIFVDFFGRKASTRSGAAQLALKYNAPVVSVMTYRTDTRSYRLIIEEIPVYEDDTVLSLTQRFTTAMENIIRQYPDQYFWMHKRWKTPPPTDGDLSVNSETDDDLEKMI